MDGWAGYLLLPIVFWPVVADWWIRHSPRKESPSLIPHLIELVFVCLASGWMIVNGPFRFNGPVWLNAGEGLELRLSLALTGWKIWWLFLVTLASGCGPQFGGNRSARGGFRSACLMLLILADGWPSFLVAWAGLCLMGPVEKDTADRFTSGIRIGSWLGVVSCCGILFWFFRFENWSDVTVWLADLGEMTHTSRARLFLALFSGSVAVLLMLPLFPLHPLAWQQSPKSLDWNFPSGVLVWVVPAVVLSIHIAPLLTLFPSIESLVQSLLLLTILFASLASCCGKSLLQTGRAVFLAQAGFCLFGFLHHDSVDYAGPCAQLVLLIAGWTAVSCGDVAGSKPLRWIALPLLFSGISGVTRVLPTMPGLLDYAEMLLLVSWFLSSVGGIDWLLKSHLTRETDDPHSAQPIAGVLWVLPLVLLPLSFLLMETRDLHALRDFTQVWKFSLAGVAGMLVGWGRMRFSPSATETGSVTEPFALVRLVQNDFYLLEVVRVLYFPFQLLAGLAGNAESNSSRRSFTVPSRLRSVPEGEGEAASEPFAWELARGLISLLALMILFVWLAR